MTNPSDKDYKKASATLNSMLDEMKNLQAVPVKLEDITQGPEQSVRGMSAANMAMLDLRIGSHAQFNHMGKDIEAVITGIFYDGFAYLELKEGALGWKN